MNAEHLEDVRSFQYSCAIIPAEGSSYGEVTARIELATADKARLKLVWKTYISTATKIKLFKSIVLGCENWTQYADNNLSSPVRLEALEMKSVR